MNYRFLHFNYIKYIVSQSFLDKENGKPHFLVFYYEQVSRPWENHNLYRKYFSELLRTGTTFSKLNMT